jgi:glycosyltransferase involved in cell wall biosynthesis
LKILVLNNYSLGRVASEIERGNKPNHHLYGVDFLKKQGYNVVIIPFIEDNVASRKNVHKFLDRFNSILGDVNQQIACLKQLNKGDVIFAPCETQTSFLSYLKALRLINNRIIVISHATPLRGKYHAIKKILFNIELRNTDTYNSLSKKISEEVNRIAAYHKSDAISWGPDINFYEKYIKKENPSNFGFFCAGRTGRDYATLIKGAELNNAQLSVFYLSIQDQFSSQNDNIFIRRDVREINFANEIAHCRAVCIPLFEYKHSAVGLTSLTDAIGMGKPVIMTKQEFIDVDIEKEGIGIWVEPGNPQKWKEAFEVLNNDKIYNEMSANSLRYRNEYFNYNTYCSQLLAYIKK